MPSRSPIGSPVVCVGEILVDCFTQQAGGSLDSVTQWSSLPGGSPANVACALVKLGTAAEFVGAVGDDRWGQALLQLLADLGVGHRGVQVHPTAPTREVYVSRDEAGDRRFLGFLGTEPDGFADAHLQASALDATVFMPVKYLVLGTIGLAYPETRQAIELCLHWALQQQQRVLVDVNWRPMFWPQPAMAAQVIRDLLRQVTFVKLSVEEADWLFDTRNPVAIATQLPNLEGVLITAGVAGCHYWLAGHSRIVPGFEVDVEDTTGAGDAFVAGFIHQLCQQGNSCLLDARYAHYAVTYANAVAALTTTRPGAVAGQPSGEEVDAFLFLRQ